MIGKNIKSKTPLCLAEVKEILDSRKKDGEFGFEQKASYDYCEKFCHLSLEDAKGLLEELGKVEKLNEEARIKIVDILPEYASQIRLICQKAKVELSENEVEKILNIVKKYLEVADKSRKVEKDEQKISESEKGEDEKKKKSQKKKGK
ncbi:MAG: RNA polymerase Rpb4 family protein [Candidatus Anstonellales archaeon]